MRCYRIPALEQTGIKKFYNGPESFTPDNQFILGEAPELRNFFVGAGFNSVGIASAGGAGPGAGRVDRRRRADQRPDRRWTSGGSRRSTATTSGCTTGSARCSACTTRCPGRTGSWRRPGRSGVRRCITCWRGAAPFRQRRWAGSGRISSPARRHAGRRSTTLGQSPTGCRGRRRSSAPPADGRGCLRPDLVRSMLIGRAATPRTALQWLCTADVGVAPGRAGLHRDAQRARRLRGRRHRHPHWARRNSCSSAAPARPSATRTTSRRYRPDGAGAALSTSRRPTRCSG